MHTEKYSQKGGEAKAMLNHYYKNWERTKDRHLLVQEKNADNYQLTVDGNIDTAITKNDLDLAIANHNSSIDELQRTTKPKARKLRKDAPILFDIVITAPPEMLDTFEHRKELPKFFEECYKYFKADFAKRGMDVEKSKLTGFVHMNETTPHMHLACMPIDKNGMLAFRQIIKRDFYQKYHEEISKHLKKELGRNLSMLIEDDKDVRRLLTRAGVDQDTYKKIKDVIRANLRNQCSELIEQKECLRRDIISIEKECKEIEEQPETGSSDSVREPTAEERTAEQDRRYGRRVRELSSDIGQTNRRIDSITEARDSDFREQKESLTREIGQLQQRLDARTADRDSSFEWERERLQSAVDRIKSAIERQFEQASGLLEQVVEYCKDNCKGLFIGASKRKQAWESGMRACKTAFVRDSNIKWGNELEDRIKAVKRQITSTHSLSSSVEERNKIASSISFSNPSHKKGRGGIDDR